jgi:release factor glutamine methyltransferase
MRPLEAVRDLARDLGEAGVPSPRVDAEIIVAHVLDLRRSQLFVVDRELSDDELHSLRSARERRKRREPLAYVLGEWGFRGLTLKVDRRVLVPRPETEVLVERCLERLRGMETPRVLEVGVGSGAVALALAEEHRGVTVLAVERSAGALAAARENLSRSSVDGRVQLRQGDLLTGVTDRFDLVVSNPPYVTPEEFETLEPEIRLFEPREALVGVGVGRSIAEAAVSVMRPGAWLLLECGDGQADSLAAGLGLLGYAKVEKTLDLAGRARVVEGQWP